jgi:hypothetical protein
MSTTITIIVHSCCTLLLSQARVLALVVENWQDGSGGGKTWGMHGRVIEIELDQINIRETS